MFFLMPACAPFANPAPDDTAPLPQDTGAVWTASEVIAHPEGRTGTRFGFAMTDAADLSGDGEAVLLISAPNEDSAKHDREGAIWLRHADSTFDRLAPTRPAAYLQFGHTVVNGGDIDGDGYTDLLINEAKRNDEAEWGGAVVVRYGSASGPDPDRDERLYSRTPNELAGYGHVLAALGDLDGDGRGDFIVGDPSANKSIGAADVYFGGDLSVTRLQPADLVPDTAFASHALGPADIDQDGRPEVLIGSIHTDQRLWRYTTLSGAPSVIDLRNGETDGRWPAALHDTDGDRYPDLIAGRDAVIFPGSPSGLQPTSRAGAGQTITDARGGVLGGVLLGNVSQAQDSQHQTGGAWLLVDGVLTTLAAPEEQPTSCLGASLGALDDAIAIGDPCQFTETGAVLLFSL